jgi:hypothetical protein
MEEEFAGIDFNSKRLEERFRRIMKTLAKRPGEYISDKTKGVNIHSCIAVSSDGLVLGVLDQTHYNRPQAKDDTMTKEVRKNRPAAILSAFRSLICSKRNTINNKKLTVIIWNAGQYGTNL